LKLEEELASAKAELQGSHLKITSLISERDRAKFEAVQAKHWAKAAALSSNAAASTTGRTAAEGGTTAASDNVSSSYDELKGELRMQRDSAASGQQGQEGVMPPERRLSIFDVDDSWSAKVGMVVCMKNSTCVDVKNIL
jgi:hypothetical protein